MVTQDLLNADKRLSYKELENINGGFTVTASFIANMASSFKVLYEIGQNFGSSIRRIILSDLCGL